VHVVVFICKSVHVVSFPLELYNVHYIFNFAERMSTNTSVVLINITAVFD